MNYPGYSLNDRFKEEIVTSRNSTVFSILYLVCWFIIISCAVFALITVQVMLYSFSFFYLILAIVAASVAVLLFYYKDVLKTEYEYSFTNGTLDFAKVFRSARRKELGSMNVRNIRACGHVAYEPFKRFLSMPGVQKKNWFLNRDANLVYLYYEKNSEKHMIIFEPSEEMVDMIRYYLEPGVYQD